MRTPPASGGQVSGGRGARARGAPATRTWPGPRVPRSGKLLERGTSPAAQAPAPAPGVATLSALPEEVGLPASSLAGPQKRSRCPLRVLCGLPGAGVGPGARGAGPLLRRSFEKCL